MQLNLQTGEKLAKLPEDDHGNRDPPKSKRYIDLNTAPSHWPKLDTDEFLVVFFIFFEVRCLAMDEVTVDFQKLFFTSTSVKVKFSDMATTVKD